MNLTRQQQIAAIALGAMSFILLILMFTRGGSSKASRSGNTLNFSCGNSSIKSSHYLKLGSESTLTGKVVSVERKTYLKECGLDYAILKWVSDSTYQDCLKSYISIGQCERERTRANLPTGFTTSVLMLIPSSTTSSFWSAGLNEGKSFSLKVWGVSSIDQNEVVGSGFTVSSAPHYWVERIN